MKKYKVTTIYSILHMFVDGICALAMFGWFTKQENSNWLFLAYNFCAFALQMPFGAMLDMFIMNHKKKMRNACLQLPYIAAVLGVVLTVLGAVVHPIVLGIGNALFHVGGGVGAIYEDHAHHWQGKALGIFVAPGALGLFLGTQIAKSEIHSWSIVTLGVCGIIAVIFVLMLYRAGSSRTMDMTMFHLDEKKGYILASGCFLVVILRSYVGMAVTFDWKSGFVLGFISALAVVLGKMAGGFLAAKWGIKYAMLFSLVAAALSYWFCENVVLGVIALFAFNMSMPITLYLLVRKFIELPGFSFGLLTFGLFLGYLPVYLGIAVPVEGNIIGAAGSIISLLILLLTMKFGGAADVD